jgi:hypothetical protein
VESGNLQVKEEGKEGKVDDEDPIKPREVEVDLLPFDPHDENDRMRQNLLECDNYFSRREHRSCFASARLFSMQSTSWSRIIRDRLSHLRPGSTESEIRNLEERLSDLLALDADRSIKDLQFEHHEAFDQARLVCPKTAE